ncbi:GerMN domain-containing protein [Candidatus Parcubacteria bacterium]|nr:GerMN domain-containing protein [Candidatus Parcubacteria bacterium]
MKKTHIIALVLAAVVILILAVFYFLPKSEVKAPEENNAPGITVDSPQPDQAITSPVIITGSVNGQGWTGFEGQVGTVKLIDSTGKELGSGILTATGDWMKLPTAFQTTIYFDYPGDGTGHLVFHNENASGEAERDKTFTLPVKLAKSSAAKTKVKVYFSNLKVESLASCDVKFYVEREVPKTQSIARAALDELLKGPTEVEQQAKFFTSINSGVKVQSLVITNGVARVDFNEELQKDVAGSCEVSAIRSQITETLKQFPTVKSIVISINGRTDDILQP